MNGVEKEDFLRLVQKRVASVSVGASTVRNQGAKGVVRKTRNFLADLDLTALKGVTDQQFEQWLNEKTDALMSEFPPGAKDNWGAARKAINVFLEESLLSRFLAKKYGLARLAKFLEVPLDNKVAKTIKEKSQKHGIPFDGRWKTIKSLTAEQSALFQKCARALAAKKGTLRGYLDLWYWQNDSDDTFER